MNQNRLNTLKDFIGFCKAELNIQTLPKISLLNDKSFVEQNRSFGEYNPQTNAIKVVALNRNLADICRSLAHELCHHRQNELDMIYNEAGDTGTDIENDANAMAGILMRDFGKRNVDVYELNTPTPLKESKRDIKFTQPKFDEEWGEAERYPDLFPDKETWYKAARLGQVQDIDCSMDIQNTDMCDGDLDDLAPEKVARAKQILNTGIVELPIVLKLGNTYELLGGNTRLTALATYGLPTKAWVIDMSKLNEIGEGTRTYSWKLEDEDADGNYFYSFDTEKSTYTVGVANLEDGMYDLSFNTTSPDGDPDVSLDTNEGVPLRVLSTVVDIAKDFIKKVEPEIVIFRPIKTKEANREDDQRRFKLYGAYLKKNLPSNYNLMTFGDTYRIVKK